MGLDAIARGLVLGILNGSRSLFGLTLTSDTSADVAPELHFNGLNGGWLIGMDVANNGGARDFVLAARKNHYDNSVEDVIYVAHNGLVRSATTAPVSASATVNVASTTGITVGMYVTGTGISGTPTVVTVNSATRVTLSAPQTIASGVNLTFANTPTIGIGMTPPASRSFRLQVAASDGEPPMGTVGVRVGPSQTGDAIQVYDSNGVKKWGIDSSFYSNTLNIRDAATPGALLTFSQNGLGSVYSYEYAGTSILWKYASGGVSLMRFDTNGDTYVYNRIIFLGEVRLGSASGTVWIDGTGSPEGVRSAPRGSLYSRLDGGAGTTLYVKESGSGNTGWVGK